MAGELADVHDGVSPNLVSVAPAMRIYANTVSINHVSDCMSKPVVRSGTSSACCQRAEPDEQLQQALKEQESFQSPSTTPAPYETKPTTDRVIFENAWVNILPKIVEQVHTQYRPFTTLDSRLIRLARCWIVATRVMQTVRHSILPQARTHTHTT
ncbi:MAG TPA: hypothetical protein V6C97_30265 [Oculatellaceae cyanobacterium]